MLVVEWSQVPGGEGNALLPDLFAKPSPTDGRRADELYDSAPPPSLGRNSNVSHNSCVSWLLRKSLMIYLSGATDVKTPRARIGCYNSLGVRWPDGYNIYIHTPKSILLEELVEVHPPIAVGVHFVKSVLKQAGGQSRKVTTVPFQLRANSLDKVVT